MWFQVAGIAIMLVFYGCYFIKMISQHKKGIKTDQIGKGKVGFVKFVEITMKIVTYLVPAVEIVSIILNTSFFAVPVRIVGVLVAAVGVAVREMMENNLKGTE